MSNVKVKITLGKASKTFDAENPKAGDFFADNLADAATDDLKRAVRFNLNRLKKTLAQSVEDSYVEAVQYAAKNMIGTKSPKGVAERNSGADLTIMDADQGSVFLSHWKALSVRTIKEQNAMRNEKSSGRFYTQTGALKQELLSKARSMVKNAGALSITYREKGKFASITAKSKKISIADFSIRLMPSIEKSIFPGIQTRSSPDLKFEEKLGVSEKSLEKLSGASNGKFIIPGTYRPLLQPIFTYWTLNRIPNILANKLDKAISRSSMTAKETK